MSTRYYTKDHEWLEVDGDQLRLGITVYAQGNLGDIVFVELPNVGDTFESGDVISGVESVKTAADIFAPIAMEITAINEALNDSPELINEDAEATWICEARLIDAAELDGLLDESAYKDFIADIE